MRCNLSILLFVTVYTELVEMATKPSKAPLQPQSLGGCTIDKDRAYTVCRRQNAVNGGMSFRRHPGDTFYTRKSVQIV